jgi:hypothetical protein
MNQIKISSYVMPTFANALIFSALPFPFPKAITALNST